MKRAVPFLTAGVLLFAAGNASAQTDAPVSVPISITVPQVLTLSVVPSISFPTDVADWRTAMEASSYVSGGSVAVSHRGNRLYNVTVGLAETELAGGGKTKSKDHLEFTTTALTDGQALGTAKDLLAADRKGSTVTTNANFRLAVTYDDEPATYQGTLVFTIVAR